MKKIFILKCFLLGFVFLFFFQSDSFAEDKMFPFVAEPILPKNQDLSIKGYFKLNVQPKEKQTIFVRLKNVTNEKQTVYINSVNALTAKNGGVNYTSESNTEYTSFIDPDFAVGDWVKVADFVVLEPNEIKNIPISVSIPDKNEGTYLGGVMFSPEIKENENELSKQKGASFYFNNHYGFVIALEFNFPVHKKKEMIQAKSAKPLFISKGIQLLVELDNLNAEIVKDMELSFEIKDDSGRTLFSETESEFKMAPKTKIMYPLFWKGKVKEGNYHLYTRVNGQIISKPLSFDIEKGQLKEYVYKNNNKKNKVIIENSSSNWWIWFLTIPGLILGIVIGRKGRK